MTIATKAKLSEHVILKTFVGDGESDRTDEPIEIIELHNGKIVKHIVNGIDVLSTS